jgi:hypothetical protein
MAKARVYRLIIDGVPLIGTKRALFAVLPLYAIEAFLWFEGGLDPAHTGIVADFKGHRYQFDRY